MSTLLRDLKASLLNLLRSPGFTLTTVLILALGIGANVAIFSIVNSLLLRPYPYRDSEQLVVVQSTNLQRGIGGITVSYADFADIASRATSFQDVAAVSMQSMSLSSGERSYQVPAAAVTPNLFALLGSQPIDGRLFLPDEDFPGRERVLVASEKLWQNELEGAVVGADGGGPAIRLDGDPASLIGVVPPEGQFPDLDQAELFFPLSREALEESRNNRVYLVLARLRPGVSPAAANRELGNLAQQLRAEHPETNEGWGFRTKALRDYRTDQVRGLLGILSLVVGFVLLLACANIANLLLQRATVREREITIRSALGASRWQIVRQLLLESLLLALAAGLAGLVVAQSGLRLLLRLLPDQLPSYMNDFRLEPNALVFMFVVAVVTALLCGLVPALRASRPDLSQMLREGGPKSTGGGGRLRSILVAAEVALALTLLVGAGLMAASFVKLQDADPGFDTGNALTLELTLPTGRYDTEEQRVAFYQRALPELGSLPGVRDAAAASFLPFAGWLRTSVTLEGQASEDARGNPLVGFQLTSTDYPKILGLPLREGRSFEDRDRAGAPPVALVNRRLAARFWPDETAVGKRIRLGIGGEDTWFQIVGILKDTKRRGLAAQSGYDVFVPYDQLPRDSGMELLLRTETAPQGLIPSVRQRLSELDPDVAIGEVRTLEQLAADSLWLQRIMSVLLNLFALLALVLAAVGIYAALAYSVGQRTREIGIRMALGAAAGDTVRHVLGGSLKLVGIGMAVGLVLAIGLGKLLSSLRFGVEGGNPLPYVVVILLLLLVASIASLLPTRKASRVDPAIVLRQE